jgi:integrase
MKGNLKVVAPRSEMTWSMPVHAENYDRSPLTEEECWALAQRTVRGREHHSSNESRTARRLLARFSQPIEDVFWLRHAGQGQGVMVIRRKVRLILHREMYQRGKMFWEWSPDEWLETICPNSMLFHEKYGSMPGCRMSIMDMAYLFGGVTDLRLLGMRKEMTETAWAYFGRNLVNEQCERVYDALQKKGYEVNAVNVLSLRQGLCTLFVLSRSPYLEDISEELVEEVSASSDHMHKAMVRVTVGLQHLGVFSPHREQVTDFLDHPFENEGMTQEWYEWCLAWYEHAVDLTPRIRRAYALRILAIGRWVYEQAPEIRAPEQWTEDLALRLRSHLCSWSHGQYSGQFAQRLLEAQERLGHPLQAISVTAYLIALRRFLTDLTRRPHAPPGEKPHRIGLDFDPKEALSTPSHLKRTADEVNPRDIDLRIWAKLAIAAATLSQSDLPQGAKYPLSLYRALALLWVTSARRPNEIVRLRLDCMRENWDQEMFDEDNQPVERVIHDQQTGKEPVRISYLYIPPGKNFRTFWIWVPEYTADAINAWKRERAPEQRQMLDWKTREYVDYLFCHRDQKVGSTFLNACLIPLLCTKAGVDRKDAKGKITGHRGRSTRLTLLRSNGVSLEDLAEYAGHSDTKTIRRYVRENPIQLHRRIRKADDISRIIEGVVDLQAAAQGLPALRWFIGYDADGEPMFCGNQSYVTCAHRLDCERCGMFIGGEKARLLHEGENTLPVTSQVPMTPLEACIANGDEVGAESYQAALKQVPAPETPDIRLIFNPEGLSNHELEKLAEVGTADALEKLRQALSAHEKKLALAKPHKTGRSALVGAQKKRVHLLQRLIPECERRMEKLPGGKQYLS